MMLAAIGVVCQTYHKRLYAPLGESSQLCLNRFTYNIGRLNAERNF